MIKVIHTIWSAHFGGIEKLVLELSNCQKDNSNLEIGILIAKGKGELLANYTDSRITCYLGNIRTGFDLHLLKYYRIWKIFSRYDIIHLHFFNPLICLLALLSGKKIFFTEHGNFGFGRKKRTTERISNLLKKYFLNSHTQYISFNSYFTKKHSEKIYGLEKVKAEVIYNGISLTDNSFQETQIDKKVGEIIKGKFVIGTSSRLAGFKRIDRLIASFALFAKDKTDVILLIIGDGILREQLMSQAKLRNISEITLFTGFCSNVKAYQMLTNICIFPSEKEPFGLAAVETLSLGKPTIVFKDGGGLTEIIEGIEKQDMVENEEELVKRMNVYFENPNEIDSKKTDRMNYAKKFDIKIMEQKIFKKYTSI